MQEKIITISRQCGSGGQTITGTTQTRNRGDSLNYHLCLDSGMFGIGKCVSMIEDACKGPGSPS